ncbi:hypothetical protein [Leisingera sp.]|uniref:hypothetical protein n=1 Tax=Leisingera sp. TaxID=1879318 RepID=UPI002B279F8C|nr:hypothetical protein [Leisingera sp.]
MILSNIPWRKAVLAAAVGLTMTTAPAGAETPQADFEFDQRVRDALLRNPDIILEVFALLEAKEEAAKAVKDQELIAKLAIPVEQMYRTPVRQALAFSHGLKLIVR